MRDIRCAERFSGPDFAVLLRLVRLGLPIALALFFEVLCLPSSRCWSPRSGSLTSLVTRSRLISAR
ncbi:hypothetical protein MJ579_16350 [Klebsiella pneumoniae]|nr:hypothetical protein MJ579_16350 [Klebsiella pneumoniae]